MNQDRLLEQVRNLQDWIDRYTDTTHPELVATRELLWRCLEWRLQDLAEMESEAA